MVMNLKKIEQIIWDDED